MEIMKNKNQNIYLGIMSGTSMDGIDLALVMFLQARYEILAFECIAYSTQLKKQLLAVNPYSTITEIGILDRKIGKAFAKAAMQLLKKQPKDIRQKVKAIGSHGQTVLHINKKETITWQIGDPHIIAAKTCIPVVADFRKADTAINGQGAPLAPLFHQALFRHDAEQPSVVLNIGGIANITVLPDNQKDKKLQGYDTGPGNALLDTWIRATKKLHWDTDGQWARSGTICQPLVQKMLQDPYFQKPPPKTTSKEYFSLQWIKEKIETFPDIAEHDVAASLVELVTITIVQEIKKTTSSSKKQFVAVCGGGIHNRYLLERLAKQNDQIYFYSTQKHGLSPDAIEAIGFAWLAKERIEGHMQDLHQITGAKGRTALGNIFLPPEKTSQCL